MIFILLPSSFAWSLIEPSTPTPTPTATTTTTLPSSLLLLLLTLIIENPLISIEQGKKNGYFSRVVVVQLLDVAAEVLLLYLSWCVVLLVCTAFVGSGFSWFLGLKIPKSMAPTATTIKKKFVVVVVENFLNQNDIFSIYFQNKFIVQ